jgi:cytochrome c-type biogenesis protein CcmH/NrfG
MGAHPPSSGGPAGHEALLAMGQQALERRDWPQAAAAFGQLVRADPAQVQDWLGLGIAAQEQKRYRLALAAF